MTIPTVTTERLILRAPQLSDFDAYADFRGSDRAAFVGGPNTPGQAWQQLCALIGQWQLRGYGRWMIADKDTDEPLGVTGLHHPLEWPEAEVAWSLFAAGEGRGIAYEAALAVRTYAYETLGWSTVISCVDSKNARSLALAKRLGCTQDGQFTHEVFGTMNVWRHPSREALA
ncbi:GNAT family N-acetyltransferase [Roseobacter sp. HKCCD9010]|uniref:GNAT family N-acetyltransferase n=1 Tax=unclassified Roseobacter TaxID=196798 RepID=UPI0014929310|nr:MULTISPECIES: GNAT family N-acetyltransferase [unclassified Roseobacter]MBF9048959.1 GNAT family N-acetyltransferase [Rhodobacterales bacterium HKCCD4356]NNV10958.1 GNAT family N-acetyltransferase [Roseobacter sp. HKCCD7357]NNV15143.1 GNAT family N-acetyltransferase [Roseobacter sp. HKCCD8768]NNV24602.1 GNAT family N-acetyltransferase [Roseobacter sp. HKCCD8192]NNV28859.1 GNAT family N-acetyltransferase [Roseobacter sp. HKCCD9061]